MVNIRQITAPLSMDVWVPVNQCGPLGFLHTIPEAKVTNLKPLTFGPCPLVVPRRLCGSLQPAPTPCLIIEISEVTCKRGFQEGFVVGVQFARVGSSHRVLTRGTLQSSFARRFRFVSHRPLSECEFLLVSP